jgi:hypothetical protein
MSSFCKVLHGLRASRSCIATGKFSASKGTAPTACGHSIASGSHITVDLDGRPNGTPLSQMEVRSLPRLGVQLTKKGNNMRRGISIG